MSEYLIQDTSLTSIADAIREKAGLEDNLAFPEGFVEAIEGISTGGSGGASIETCAVTFNESAASWLSSRTDVKTSIYYTTADSSEIRWDVIMLTNEILPLTVYVVPSTYMLIGDTVSYVENAITIDGDCYFEFVVHHSEEGPTSILIAIDGNATIGGS